MKVVFVSNFMNHHQIGLCDELASLLGDKNFKFIAQSKTPNEQANLGYKEFNSSREYIIKEYEVGKDYTSKVIDESDIVIITFSQGAKPIRRAQRDNKIIFWYCESLFKEYNKFRILAKIIRAKYYFDFIDNNNQYFLNASSYGYHDLQILDKNKYRNISFTFGYFPIFDFKEEFSRNTDSSFSMLFVGRLIKWKHPEYIFDCADVLDEHNIDYHINVVGDGELVKYLQKEIENRNLENKITLIGPVDSGKVKEYYKSHDVFLFASDRREGWGAVLSEAMLYGCVPLANIDAGATNIFISNGINGYIFKDKKTLKEGCLNLYELKKEGNLFEIARRNHEMMLKTWNYKEAARRLFNVMKAIYEGKNYILYEVNDLMGLQNDENKCSC